MNRPSLTIFRQARSIAQQWAKDRYRNVNQNPRGVDFIFDASWADGTVRDLLKANGRRRTLPNIAALASFISRVARHTMLKIAATA